MTAAESALDANATKARARYLEMLAEARGQRDALADAAEEAFAFLTITEFDWGEEDAALPRLRAVRSGLTAALRAAGRVP